MDFIKKYWKRGLFFTLLLVLFVPMSVKMFNLFDEEPLRGVSIPTEKPFLNDSTWFNGSYQKNQEKYINENLGLRSTLIRVNNQLNFSLYKKTSAEKVVIGKDNYLFEVNYILATTGQDYIGDDKINNLLNEAKQCQNILDSMSINMLFVFAPGKATYFEEHIPDRYMANKGSKTNYQEILHSCKKAGINYIDFNSWFLNMKDTTPHPLFPKAGIHWTYYGMYLCADSLISKVETDLNQDIPEISLAKLEVSSEQRHTEYDLGNLLNLYYPIETYDLAYPSISYHIENKYKPKVLVIGDSFYWNMYYSGIPSNVFNSLEYWYYNSKCYNDGTATPYNETKNFNYIDEISKFEYIIILQTDGGLNNFGFGFFDKIINNIDSNFQSKIDEYINQIKNSPEWLKQVEEKAAERGITLEEMLFIDANYMYEKSKE